MDSIERALADLTDWVAFETLCCRVLNSEGYKVDPRGGSGDEGRDAVEGDDVTFQYSLQSDTAKKLGKELTRYKTTGKRPREYVYVTNRKIASKTKEKFIALFGELGMRLQVFDRQWLSGKLGASKLTHLRNDLLAASLMRAPDTVRLTLSSPSRNSMLAVLDEGMKSGITDERLGRIRALMKAQAYDGARTLLREVLEQARLPKDQMFEAHTHLGNVLFHQGRIAEAEVEWRAAIATGVPNTVPAANLATALLFFDKKNSDAREVVEHGLQIDPRSPGLLNLVGLLEWEAGNTPHALELFNQAYSIEERPEFLLNDWNLRSERGLPPSDLDIEKALERYPTHKELLLLSANRLVDRFQERHNSALLQKGTETIARALADFLPRIEKERSRTPFSPLDWEWIGCALNTMAGLVYWQGDYGRAAGLLELAVLFNDVPLYKFTLGQIQIALGRVTDAIESYEAAANGGFDKADLWLQLGNAHYMRYRQSRQIRDIQRAAECFERASKTFPFALVNLAQLFWEIGRKDKAREIAEAAVKANPDEPVAQCNYLIYSSDDDPRAVLAGMGAIEAQHPTNSTVLMVIAEKHYRLGEWSKAYAYFVRAEAAAGPNALLLEQLYPLAADALKKSVGGDSGRLKALEYLLEASKRLPNNAAIAAKIRDLTELRD